MKKTQRIAWAFCFLNLPRWTPSPPFWFKPLALKLTETCRAVWPSNLLFSIRCKFRWGSAGLPRAILRVRRAQWTFQQKACPFTCKAILDRVGVPCHYYVHLSVCFEERGISGGYVGAARKVSPDWLQKTMTCHCFNCFSIVLGQG